MQITLSPLAQRDLEAIGDFIADDNPKRAVSFVAELREQCVTIAKAPQACRLRPELGGGCAFMRAWQLRDFLYRNQNSADRRSRSSRCDGSSGVIPD